MKSTKKSAKKRKRKREKLLIGIIIAIIILAPIICYSWYYYSGMYGRLKLTISLDEETEPIIINFTNPVRFILTIKNIGDTTIRILPGRVNVECYSSATDCGFTVAGKPMKPKYSDSDLITLQPGSSYTTSWGNLLFCHSPGMKYFFGEYRVVAYDGFVFAPHWEGELESEIIQIEVIE